MKKYYFALVLTLFVLPFFAQNIPSYVPKDGLVGYWPFNGNANDASGNGNHGTNNGATMTTDKNGIANSAYNFDGNSSIYNNGNDLKTLIDNNNSFSVSLWFKQNDNHVTPTDYDEMVLFAIDGQNINPYKRVWTLLGQSNTNTYFEFQRFNNSTGTNNSRNSLDNIYANSNIWHNLIIIYSNNQFQMIYDGNTLNQLNTFNTALSGNMSNNDNSVIGLTFGANNQGNRAKFNGKLDDIAIYNRALTEQEITALYSENNPCTSVPTIKSEGPTTFVEGDTLILKTNNGAGNTFQWQKDGVAIVGATDSIYKVTSSGNYTVTVTEQAGLCKETSKGVLVTVTPKITPTIPSYIPTNGLVGYWPFNGNANDESGNGNHGTVNGATLSADRSGKSNSAYSFDGNDVITVNSTATLSLQDKFTISLWVVRNNNTFMGFISKRRNAIGGISYHISGDGSGQGVGINNDPEGCPNCNIGASNSLTNFSDWNHFVGLWDGIRLKFYQNGSLVSDVNGVLGNGNTLFDFNSQLEIGRYLSNSLNGQSDDIAVYNRALTEKEITALYIGCTSETATSSNFNSLLLSTGSSVSLSAEPQGGVFTGASIDSNQFVPSKAKIGANKVQYNFKNSKGCYDSTLFTMIVADTVGTTCKKYDTITVTNNITKYDTVTVKNNVYDTVTVTNNVTKYDTVKVNTYDTITITKNVTKYDTVIVPKTVTKYDTVTVTNNVTKYDTVIVKTNVFDTVKVNTYDTITVTNSVTKYDTVLVNKYDTITVTDTVSILKIKFQLTTGIKANQMTSMSIYPNPTSDVLIIDASDLAAITGYSYRILDVLGKEVYNALVSTAKTEISLKTLGAKGMYVLHILDANKQSVQTKQIILE